MRTFDMGILALDQAVADRRGEIMAKALAAKSPLPVIDGSGLISSDSTVVSRMIIRQIPGPGA